jgi:hypothetical protein
MEVITMLTFLVSQLIDYDEDGNIIGYPDSVICTYKPSIFGKRLKIKKPSKDN